MVRIGVCLMLLALSGCGMAPAALCVFDCRFALTVQEPAKRDVVSSAGRRQALSVSDRHPQGRDADRRLGERSE